MPSGHAAELARLLAAGFVLLGLAGCGTETVRVVFVPAPTTTTTSTTTPTTTTIDASNPLNSHSVIARWLNNETHDRGLSPPNTKRALARLAHPTTT